MEEYSLDIAAHIWYYNYGRDTQSCVRKLTFIVFRRIYRQSGRRKELYMSWFAEEWKNFTNIQAIPATGVNEAAAEKSEVKKIMIDGTVYIEAKDMRYNLNGQKVK